MNLSPDVEKIIEALSIINPDFYVVPEDIDHAVDRAIRLIEGNAFLACSGKSAEFKRGFVIGYAESLKK